MAVNFTEVSHCIFNFDGALMDTGTVLKAIMTELLAGYSHPYTEEMHNKILCLNEEAIGQIVIEHFELPLTIAQFLDKFEYVARDKFRKGKLIKGVEAVIQHLVHHNVPIAIVTDSGKVFLDLKCAYKRNFFDLFDHYICGATDRRVNNPKPASDIYIIAASRFHSRPDCKDCLVFESCLNGVEAAIAAGMQVIYIPMTKVDDNTSRNLASKTITSYEEFKPEEFGLPPFRSCNC